MAGEAIIISVLRDILDEVKELRKELKAQTEVVVQSDADWYRVANSLGEVL